MSSFTIEELTIEQVHSAYRNKTLTAEALTAAYLDRIDKLDKSDDGPKLNALITLNPQAMTLAKELDAKFANNGGFVGPLHGIPVVVKDHIMTKGIKTTFGSIVAKDFVPDVDATPVVKLKEAGAIILGKAALPDFGTDYFSTSSVAGCVRNPYDLERDSGASSSGTAVAIAANLAMVGLGSDSGGSIRIPSSFCNVVGVRPTVGLISGHGSSPGILGQSTHGPMGRTVTDVALMLDVLTGFDENDSLTAVHSFAGDMMAKSFAADLGSLPKGSAPRIGVVRSMLGEDTEADQVAVKTVIEHALDALRQSGAQVVDVDIPDLEMYLQGTNMFLTRARYDLDQWLKPNLGVTCAEIASSGRCPPENVMIPWISYNGLETPYDNGASGSSDYAKQVDLRDAFQRAVLVAMRKHGVSALAFPAVKVPPPRYVDVDTTMRSALPLNVGFASQLRWPSVCVPAGFTKDGELPVGMEVVGPPLQDRVLLSWAYRVEQAVKARRAPAFGVSK